MAKPKSRLDGANGGLTDSNVIPVSVEKSINNWDSEDERTKQELAYYQHLEARLISQMVKEVNALLAMLRTKTNVICALDRQYLRAKISLLSSKLEASEMCEQQIMKIRSAARRASNLQS